MNMTRHGGWLIRALALACAVLLALAIVEALALRDIRGELQRLRDERQQVKAGEMQAWTRLAGEEFAQAGQGLHNFYLEPGDGLGRPGGLCPGGQPDFNAVARWVLGVFAPARASGRTLDAALNAMYEALRRSDAYRERKGTSRLVPLRYVP